MLEKKKKSPGSSNSTYDLFMFRTTVHWSWRVSFYRVAHMCVCAVVGHAAAAILSEKCVKAIRNLFFLYPCLSFPYRVRSSFYD